MIVRRSLSRRRGDGERLGGLLMEVRGVSAERIETFGRGGAIYAQGYERRRMARMIGVVRG